MSTDDYYAHISPDGHSEYTFDPSALGGNHQKNQVPIMREPVGGKTQEKSEQESKLWTGRDFQI
eukprot:4153879-Amphidinium_carterae.1